MAGLLSTVVGAARRGALAAADWLLGSARELQADQLGTYLGAMRTRGERARFRVGPPGLGLVFDALFTPAGARTVLATDADAYRKEAPAFTELKAIVGEGLVTSEGETWRRQRRTLQPLFTRRHVAAAVPGIAAEAEAMAARWRATAAAGGIVELVEECTAYMLRVLGRAVFGQDLEATIDLLGRAVPVLNDHAARRGLAAVRLPRWMPLPANRRAAASQRELETAVDALIAQRRGGEDGEGLLGLLLDARDPETGQALSDREIRDQVLTFLLVGHETTASALAFTLDLLARDPRAQAQVRAEVRSVLGHEGIVAERLEELVYTGAVVQEGLRLYPSAHTLVRRARPGGPIVGERTEEGRIVAVSIWGIHRNPTVWPEADRFDPDRFVDPPHDRDRYAHLPFGGGPRQCIGAHLAIAKLVVGVAVLVRNVQLHPIGGPPAVRAALSLAPVAPLPLRISGIAADGAGAPPG